MNTAATIGAASTGLVLAKKFFNGGTCHLSPDLTDKIVIVTGANCGMGFETARRFAKLKAKVILACRNPIEAQKAVQKIRAEVKDAQVEWMKLDLGNLKSVREFADNFNSKYNRLDILVNNAGTFLDKQEYTSDGFEMNFGTNYLGHFFLTQLLKDSLFRAAPSRVVNISSQLHKLSKIHWDNLNLDGEWGPIKSYGQSKLANILFTKEFNKKYENLGVKAVAVHPGVVRTPAYRHMLEHFSGKVIAGATYPGLLLTFKSSRQGAQTALQCSLMDHKDLVGGSYYKDCHPSNPSTESLSSNEASRLWKKSFELLNLKEGAESL